MLGINQFPRHYWTSEVMQNSFFYCDKRAGVTSLMCRDLFHYETGIHPEDWDHICNPPVEGLVGDIWQCSKCKVWYVADFNIVDSDEGQKALNKQRSILEQENVFSIFSKQERNR